MPYPYYCHSLHPNYKVVVKVATCNCDIALISIVAIIIIPDFNSSSSIGDLSRKRVLNQTMLKVVGDKSQILEWPDHGFYLEVPDGALPPEETAEVTVRVILDDQFQIPSNSQLISALYWITSTRVFLKDVAVNIQHSAVIRSREDHAKFKFIVAKSSQPNHYREMEGKVQADNQYGTIMLKTFSEVGVIAFENTDCRCTAHIFYKSFPQSDDMEYHFVVIQKLDVLTKVC